MKVSGMGLAPCGSEFSWETVECDLLHGNGNGLLEDMDFHDIDDSGHSVTYYLVRLRERDSEAVDQIWRRYFERLLPVARAMLRGVSDAAVDQEDVLISVFDRFFRAASNGRFPRLNDRDDLWRILLMLTERKIRDHYRRQSAAKRGHGVFVNGESAGRLDVSGLASIVDRGPSAEFVAQFNEQLSLCMQQLGDRTLHDIALHKLEGYTNREIAERMQMSLSGVERKLRLIRRRWEA